MRNLPKLILLAALSAGWLYCQTTAPPNTTDSDSSILDDGIADVPASDIAGWFLTFDPANQWTSEANIETMESWLAVVEQVENDPALLQQLYGLGMTSSEVFATNEALTSDLSTAQGAVSEPATLGLLGGSLALLGLYASRPGRRPDHRLRLCLAMKD